MDEELFSAIEDENYGLAKQLLLKGAKADKLVRDGISALHLIAGKDSQENFKVLEYCTQNTRSNTNIKSSEGLTPVHVAALWGRVQNLKLLTSRGGNIHELDDEGNNVLDFASLSSENDATDCIKFLLEFENSKTHAEPQKEGQEPYYDSEFTESFYTAIGEANDSILDHSAVTFPKLHPWNVKISSTDYDATLIDGLSNLSVASDSFADLNEAIIKDFNFLAEETIQYDDSRDEDLQDEFGDTTVFYDWKELNESALDESVAIPEDLIKLTIPELRNKLKDHGEIPGPITPATKHLYVKRLARLHTGITYSKDSQCADFLPEIRKLMDGRAEIPDLCAEEESMCEEFVLKKNWREGTEKSSFNYLLIDPRVTQNLPARAKKMPFEDVFRVFVMAIFYVGKGKRARPYAHLHEALQLSKHSPKIQQIRDIWAAGLGVVSLHIFQSVIPVEAYTREACMIDALGLSRLTNKKRGDYYGRALSWPPRKRREMGAYLLTRALKILLNEGERQLRTTDLRAHSS